MARSATLLAFLLLLLSGCSSLLDEEDETKGWSAQKFYNEAKAAMADGDYERAIRYYEGLEARYPFGNYATQVQLDVGYAYYKNNQPDSAIAALNRFIKLHPRNPFVDYAYYLKGIVNFNQNLSFISRFAPTDISQRDPGTAMDAFRDFSELLQRFPDSQYAPDARKRMIYLRNNLAMHEVHAGSYYLRKGAYLAAANRGAYVVEKFQRTPAVKPALLIMIRAYDAMGLTGLAQDTRRVLALNEAKGVFKFNTREQEEKSWGKELWDFLELDKN
ncbi:MAG TPA: outer membrane protein assembly factor BamD [Sedimenticola sp.]|nr:outer membrane protein assembly factor BamD [Sedimenticola sp.]